MLSGFGKDALVNGNGAKTQARVTSDVENDAKTQANNMCTPLPRMIRGAICLEPHNITIFTRTNAFAKSDMIKLRPSGLCSGTNGSGTSGVHESPHPLRLMQSTPCVQNDPFFGWKRILEICRGCRGRIEWKHGFPQNMQEMKALQLRYKEDRGFGEYRGSKGSL